MGASIDENKPMMGFGYAGIGSTGPGPRGGRSLSHPSLKVWLWKRWPLLLMGSVCGLFLVRWAVSPSSGSAPETALEKQEHQQLKSKHSRVKDGKVRLSDLVGAAIHLSEIAAHEIMEVKLGGKEEAVVKGKTDEGVDEPVTVADARSNAVFVNGLRELFPGIDILSEETDPEEADVGISGLQSVELEQDPWLDLKDVLVTVDPLDATKEFTEDLLHFVTTMVCVVHKGKPIAGIINEPFAKDESAIWGVVLEEEKFSAVHGLQASQADATLAKESVVISRSHTGAGADVVSEYLPGKKPVFAGGSGYKALQVLKGDANGYVHVTKIKSWDVCAADAVVHAAGGEFTNLKGKPLVYKKDDPMMAGGIIAAADPTSHAWYVDQLQTVEMPAGHKR